MSSDDATAPPASRISGRTSPGQGRSSTRHRCSARPSTATDVDALCHELDASLQRVEQSLHTLQEVSASVLGFSPEAYENRAIISARTQLARHRFDELAARYEALRAEFLRSRASFRGRPGGRIGTLEPAVVRRAVAYIEARVDPRTEISSGSTSSADIAAAAGVGVRALQQAFRRHRGTTPTGLLRDLRFERAHQDLRAAEPSASVAAIATRWGFTHPSHFAAGYRRRYGQSPRHTLKT